MSYVSLDIIQKMTKTSALNEIFLKLKKARIALTREEMAKKLEISRSKLYRKWEKPAEEVKDLLEGAQKLLSDTETVSRETLNEDQAPYGKAIDKLVKVISQHSEMLLKQTSTIYSQQETIRMCMFRCLPCLSNTNIKTKKHFSTFSSRSTSVLNYVITISDQ